MNYAQIDAHGLCVGISELSGEVDRENLIPIAQGENPIGHKWNGEEWIVPPETQPTNQNILNAPEHGFGGPQGKEIFHGNR